MKENFLQLKDSLEPKKMFFNAGYQFQGWLY